MKRIFTVIATAVICALILIAVPSQAVAAPGELLVNGIDILTVADRTVQCGEGTATYDSSTGVLTLNNAEFDFQGTGREGIEFYEPEVELTIELVGANTVGNIEAAGDLTISGDGSLTLAPDDSLGAVNVDQGDVVIDGITVVANGYISSAGGSVRIVSGSSVEVNHTDIGGKGLLAWGSVEVLDSELTVTSDSNAVNAWGTESSEFRANNSSLNLVATEDSGFETGAVYSRGSILLDNTNGVVSGSGASLHTELGDITISGGTIHASATSHSSDNPGYALMSNRAINLTGGVITLEGEAGVMYVAKDTGNVSFGDNPWYQWLTSPAGNLSLSSENPYVYGDKQNTYLHIEPAGTTYELVVEGGSGNGSYAPGTEVAISAGTPTADGHFAAWNVTTGNDGILADASAAETTFTVPVGGATVSATLESHTLTHHEGQHPTCTEPGWAAYDTCVECGYSSYTVLPATGHSFENGVCTVCGATDQDFEPDSQNPESDQDESTENETSSKTTTDEAAKESIPLTGENAFPVALLAAVAGAGTIAVATLVRRRKK